MDKIPFSLDLPVDSEHRSREDKPALALEHHGPDHRVDDTRPLLDEKLRSNADLYPSEEAQKRFHLPKALDQKALRMWTQAWGRAKGLR